MMIFAALYLGILGTKLAIIILILLTPVAIWMHKRFPRLISVPVTLLGVFILIDGLGYFLMPRFEECISPDQIFCGFYFAGDLPLLPANLSSEEEQYWLGIPCGVALIFINNWLLCKVLKRRRIIEAEFQEA